MELNTMWEAAFPERKRPELYSSNVVDEDGYLPLNEPGAFLMDGVPTLTTSQLYALSSNNALALQLAQQEWTSLEKLANHIKSRDPIAQPIKDPQSLPTNLLFEEEKEATLYGYKYERNRKMLPARFTVSENVTDQEKFDCREDPEPFLQGNFIPTDKQYRTLMATAKAEGREKNPDGFEPYRENFALLPRVKGTWIPKALSREDPQPYKARGKDGEHRAGLIEGGESRRTRFNGERVPPTNGRSPVPTFSSGVTTPGGKRAETPSDLDPETPLLKRRRIENGTGMNTPTGRWSYQQNRKIEMNTDEFPNVAAQSRVHTGHHNQYTKRREREGLEGVFRPEFQLMPSEAGKSRGTASPHVSVNGQSTRSGSQAPSDFARMSTDEKRSHNFKDRDLLDAISQDYLWLNDDPALATQWKDKIMAAEFPVRTLAMLRKWHEWKKENRHKRPRTKKKPQDGEDGEIGGNEKLKKSNPKLRRVLNRTNSRETPVPASPLARSFNAADIAEADDINSVSTQLSQQQNYPSSQLRRTLEYPGTEDELQVSITPEEEEDDEEKDGTWQNGSQTSEEWKPRFVNGFRGEAMGRTQSQPTPEDTVTVYDARSTPSKKSRLSPSTSSVTPTRRSLRNPRRDST